ncbi:C-type mannose receptor 2-like [Lineus longissimus]|uniref:C-type mannose receptor 2-like n=1 Tax=Lineus longissimus TaxID=88925 RepID=UPI002B4E71DC
MMDGFKCFATFCILITVALENFVGGNFQGCAGSGFIAFKDRCYFFSISQWLKIRNADNTCKAQGADLVGIQTKEEFDFLVDEIERRIGLTDDDPFKYSTWWRKQFWTSGRREPGKLGWRWDQSRIPMTQAEVNPVRSTEALTFTAWLQDEPSRVYEKGITLVFSGGVWGWNDYVITDDLSFICEKKLASIRSNCPPDFRRFRDSCYLFVDSSDKGQKRAKLHCNEFGAYLVAINDEPEFDFLCKSLESIKRSQGLRVEYEEWWTGGTQTNFSASILSAPWMEWVWDTTVPQLTLSPWFRNRPRGMLDDTYLALYFKDSRWWWYDEDRTSSLDFVCEKAMQRALLGGEDEKECPQRWRTFQGHCYYFSIHNNKARQGAEETCMHMGARLVALETEAELEFLRTTMREVKHFDDVKWWTGGIPIARQWVWSKDYMLFKDYPDQFLGWAPGEPNNWDDQENFITLLYNNTWGLNDVPNRDHISLPFICEKQRQDNDGVYCPSKIGRTKLTKLPVTGDNWATLMLDNTFQCSGHIKIWRYYRGHSNGTAYAGVWRKISDQKYRLIKKTTFQPAGIGRKTVILRHPIGVAAGDIIGVHYDNAHAHGGIITSAKMEDDAVAENELYTTLSAPIYNDQVHDGMIVDFNLHDPKVAKKTYALFAKLMKIDRV